MTSRRDEAKPEVSVPSDDDEWEDLYDESEENMINKLSKLSLANKKTKPKTTKSPTAAKPEAAKIDYLKFEPKKPESQPVEAEKSEDDEFLRPEYAHILEIYDFPVFFKNENIMNAFASGIGSDNLAIKWVDDTHCLGIFPSAAEAQRALKLASQVVKTRALFEASEVSREMARRKIDYLKPFKQRPQTSSLVASRLIGASLGIRVPKEKIDMEKTKLKIAKEKNQKEKDLKESIWNGET